MLKRILILSLFYILLLTACGQTGPLYLPTTSSSDHQTRAVHISTDLGEKH